MAKKRHVPGAGAEYANIVEIFSAKSARGRGEIFVLHSLMVFEPEFELMGRPRKVLALIYTMQG